MTKRTTKRRKADPLAGRRHPPFGATKAQSKLHAKEREYKNRIHELEQNLAAVIARGDATTKALDEAHRAIVQQKPTTQRITAMRNLSVMSVANIVAAGIEDEVIVIAAWLLDVERAQGLATGNTPRVVFDPPAVPPVRTVL